MQSLITPGTITATVASAGGLVVASLTLLRRRTQLCSPVQPAHNPREHHVWKGHRTHARPHPMLPCDHGSLPALHSLHALQWIWYLLIPATDFFSADRSVRSLRNYSCLLFWIICVEAMYANGCLPALHIRHALQWIWYVLIRPTDFVLADISVTPKIICFDYTSLLKIFVVYIYYKHLILLWIIVFI